MNDDLHFDFLPTPRARLGESPVWSRAGRCLWWVDIEGRRVFRTDASIGETREWSAPEMVGILVLAEDDTPITGMETGLYRLDTHAGSFERVAALTARGVRFNDAAVDAKGRIWAATMEFDYRQPVGALYRIDPDCTMRAVVNGLYIPNGLAIDAARGRLYLSDSHPGIRTIWVADLDVDTGQVGERRVFARFSEVDGRPDGAALDAAGNYWIAGVGGGCLHVFSPEGNHLALYRVPTKYPTKVAFGGPNLTDLYLTSKAGAGESGRLAVASTTTRGSPGGVFGRQEHRRNGRTWPKVRHALNNHDE